MNITLQPLVQSSKKLPYSDFERARNDHIHKQINFILNQVTCELETKFNIQKNSGIKFVEI